MRETLRRFEGAGLGWRLPDGMSDGDLEAALYANYGNKRGHRRHAEPDWPTVHRELKRKHVTLVIVWDEHIAANPWAERVSNLTKVLGREATLEEMLTATEIHQMTPAEVDAQRASFVRGMTARCEHVELDFEQCPRCRR